MSKTYNQSGHLFLTPMKRIVLDDHGSETFAPPHDKIIMTKEELSNGIKVEEFVKRLMRAGV